jgi:hypothetical protein
VFGSEVPRIDPQFEHIGRRILPKLKGSPLDMKGIGARSLKEEGVN